MNRGNGNEHASASNQGGFDSTGIKLQTLGMVLVVWWNAYGRFR